MWNTIGHEKATSILRRGMERDRLSHAYLLTGPRQVGKMTLAQDFARMANCPGPDRPCGDCAQCQRITRGVHTDVQVVGLAGPSEATTAMAIAIDQVRQVQKDASLKPFEGACRVFIFDGAETLSPDAANSLLKTLEEPPPQVAILLLALDRADLLPTIVSRCQHLELKPLPPAMLARELEARYRLDADRALALARASRGRPGWAIQAIDDPGVLERRQETISSILDTVAGPIPERFEYAARLAGGFSANRGAVYRELDLWVELWRDLLLTSEGMPELVANTSLAARFADVGAALSREQVSQAVRAIRATIKYLDQNVNPRLALEDLMLTLPRAHAA